jgi:hypothetical protein
MADYIRWLAPQMDDLKGSLREKVIKYRDAYMSAIKGKGHEQAPENFSQLFIGLMYFLRWAFEAGRLTAEEHNRHLAEGGRTLAELLGLQVEYQRDADEALKFINLLKAALVSGRCHLADIKTGGMPQNHDRFGWRSEQRGEFQETIPQGNCVGHTDGTDLAAVDRRTAGKIRTQIRKSVCGVTTEVMHLSGHFECPVGLWKQGMVRVRVRWTLWTLTFHI